MNLKTIRYLLFLILVPLGNSAQAEIQVTDDLGQVIALEAPAQRVVSLAPHLTEMMFTLGVGDRVVGTARYSNYPPAASQIPNVGDAFAVSIESVVALRPDLILAWHTGGVNKGVNRLRDLGFPVYVNEAPTLNSIGDTLRKLGALTAAPGSDKVADHYGSRLKSLAQAFEQPPRVAFQISDIDLYLVSDDHLIGQAIRHCGGVNAFPDLPGSVSQVSQEAIIEENPAYIFYTRVAGAPVNPWVERWRSFEVLTGQLVAIDPNVISRPSSRMLAGIEQICSVLKNEHRIR